MASQIFDVRLFSSEDASLWNRFVHESKNGTFLFHRDYMDYHKDRFHDSSLLISKKGNLYALLPANRDGDTLVSHGGLTYGGLLLNHKATATEVIEIMQQASIFLHANGIRKVIYRPTPWIYHALPSEEDLYALTMTLGAQLAYREISTAIKLGNEETYYTTLRKRCIKRAMSYGLSVRETSDFESFWNILTKVLQERHQTNPVHSLSEILLLKDRFPQNIRLFMAYKDSHPLGGTLVYLTHNVAHAQYIAANEDGRKYGALDLTFSHLIEHTFQGVQYFDFGKSTELCGTRLNEPLLFQKEGFGGRAICYDTYIFSV